MIRRCFVFALSASLASTLAFVPLSASHAQPEPMSAYWPNLDGLAWVFDQHYEDFLLPEIIDNIVTYRFDGTTTAPIGIDAQFWEATVSGDVGTAGTSEGAAEHPALRVPPSISDPLLRNLWIARPDLRERILARVAGEHPCPENAVPGQISILLFGSAAWVKDEVEIAAWRCNADNLRSWVWMTSDLSIGSTYVLQLLPDLTSDVFLYGTVAGFEEVTVLGGTYGDCLRMEYRIDYGEGTCTDESGTPTGTVVFETVGFNHYAPGVGPVDSFEQFKLVSISNGCFVPVEPGDVLSEVSLDLVASPPVPTLETSWGRLKSSFGEQRLGH